MFYVYYLVWMDMNKFMWSAFCVLFVCSVQFSRTENLFKSVYFMPTITYVGYNNSVVDYQIDIRGFVDVY